MTGRVLLERGAGASIVAALALACGVLLVANRADAGPNGGAMVVFESGGDLYAVAPSGGRTVRLTATKPKEYGQVVSPDGRSVAFLRDGGISTMKLDGSGKRIVTRGNDRSPTWSPDGKTLYFSRSGRQRFGNPRRRYPAAWILSVSASGGAVHQVMRSDTKDGDCQHDPAVSPGGGRIAYTDWDACEGGTSSPRLRVVDLAGKPTDDLAKLGRNGFYPNPEHSCPAWSPDGRQLAFFHQRTLSVANRDGSGEHRIVPDHLAGSSLTYERPAWSPDGKWIAFTRNYTTLFVVHPDGTGLKVLRRTHGNQSPGLAGWLSRLP